MKNKLIFKILRIIIGIIFTGLIIFTILNHLDMVLKEENNYSFIQVIIALLFYVIVYYSSIILHEVGHLIFGLKSKLKFISFNIKGFSIIKKNKKLVIEKRKITKDIGGYCNMEFIDSIKYSKKDVILYFYGGIIINIIIAIIFFIILLLSSNQYIKLISILYILYNAYLSILNSIPYTNIIGVNTDMKHIVNYLHDDNYIKKIITINKMFSHYEKNNSLIGIDEDLLYIPEEFFNDYDITIALYYISYLSEKRKYKKMNESIDYVLSKTNDTITESSINALKVQKIDCIIHTKFDKDKIIEIWDNSFNKYINQLSIVSITGLVFKYLYYKVVDDEEKANDILKEYENRKLNYHNKQEILESNEFIEIINKNI